MDGLLELAAHYDADVPVLDFPDGQRVRGDDPRIDEALSAHVGRPVTFAREEQVSHFDEGPLHLVTSSSVQSLERAHGHAVDQRRLRANLLLETSTGGGFVEDNWSGRRIRVGDRAILEIGYPMPRCVMLNLDQRDLPYDRELLGTLGRVNDAQIGVVADVLVPGEVAAGDAVLLLD